MSRLSKKVSGDKPTLGDLAKRAAGGRSSSEHSKRGTSNADIVLAAWLLDSRPDEAEGIYGTDEVFEEALRSIGRASEIAAKAVAESIEFGREIDGTERMIDAILERNDKALRELIDERG